MTDDKQNYLQVRSLLIDGCMMVCELWLEVCATYSPQQARSRALNILRAAAYAESEASIFRAISGIGHKGFWKIPNDRIKTAVATLQLVRKQRLPLPDDIQGIFGFNTQLPLVNLVWKDAQLSLHLDEAKKHAITLLECAESVETDGFLMQHLEHEDWQILMDEYRLHRQKSWLEGLI
jgi:hypothetical protein